MPGGCRSNSARLYKPLQISPVRTDFSGVMEPFHPGIFDRQGAIPVSVPSAFRLHRRADSERLSLQLERDGRVETRLVRDPDRSTRWWRRSVCRSMCCPTRSTRAAGQRRDGGVLHRNHHAVAPDAVGAGMHPTSSRPPARHSVGSESRDRLGALPAETEAARTGTSPQRSLARTWSGRTAAGALENALAPRQGGGWSHAS